ncbi:pyrimidine/purine nucleoside phosphorylase [Candidatus Woesearchaeota archaeon]|nr:pyrimidine/purine nucleoside phosphorylase [Candidatus Woesearchaeota archaeon]
MNRQEAISVLLNKWPTVEDLRKNHYAGLSKVGLGGLLDGEFGLGEDRKPAFNFYELNGLYIASRPLVQGREKDPTVGIIFPGEAECGTGNNSEVMTILEGALGAYVNGKDEGIFRPYGSVSAPAESTFRFIASKPVFYHCQYEPKK